MTEPGVRFWKDRECGEILVVDDESSMRFLLRMTFEIEGHEVDEAPNGLAAIEGIEGGRVPDLVATDYMMPVMNGGELIARLRREPGDARGSRRPDQLEPRRGARHASADASSASRSTRSRSPSRRRSCCAARDRDDRLTTGDASLDLVLGGGLPDGSLIIVAGPPGSGKTILAQQICFANATAERKAIYYTTWSEPHDKLVRHLEPFAFFDRGALGDRVEFLHLAELIGRRRRRRTRRAADEILRQSFEAKPAIIVIDSSKALHDVVDAGRSSPSDLRPREQGRLQRRSVDPGRRVLGRGDALTARVRRRRRDRPARERTARAYRPPLATRLEDAGSRDLCRAAQLPDRSSGFEVFPRLETTLPRRVPTLKIVPRSATRCWTARSAEASRAGTRPC